MNNIKRFLDIFFSLISLIFLSPLLLFVSIILLFTGERKIFFIQKRYGKDGKKFGLIKFATMLENSPHTHTGTITIKNDPRILPIGKILRKFKINELPQLINVLKGQMSIIGPRPLTSRCIKSYSSNDMKNILSIRPGLSGMGSIFLFNEEELTYDENIDTFYDEVIMNYKLSLEKYFIQNNNLKNYFKIIFLTIYIMIVKDQRLLPKFFKRIPPIPKKIKNKINLITEVAKLHQDSIEEGFISSLDLKSIEFIYMAINSSNRNKIFTIYYDDQLVAFLCFVTSKKHILNYFLKNPLKVLIFFFSTIFKFIHNLNLILLNLSNKKLSPEFELTNNQLFSIAVKKEFRRQKFAKKLFDDLIKYCVKNNYNEFHIKVGLNLDANKFYLSNGAVKIDTIRQKNKYTNLYIYKI